MQSFFLHNGQITVNVLNSGINRSIGIYKIYIKKKQCKSWVSIDCQ